MNRQDQANKVLSMVRNGPHWCTIGPKSGRLDEADAKEATEQYQLWAESWIVPALKALIPELKEEN